MTRTAGTRGTGQCRTSHLAARAGVAMAAMAVAALSGVLPAQAGAAEAADDLASAPAVLSAPVPGEEWQWMLSAVPTATHLAADPDVRAWDVDGFDTSASKVAAIHALPALAVCYISAGSWEDWRSDASSFPAAVKGKALDGWAGEKWLDVRNLTVLKPIMTARMQMCKDKGFDAVEPDNIDGYTNQSGFPLTGTHQLAYNRMLATAAHSLGLSIALKNDVDQVKALAPDFDFAINEQCYQYNECGVYDAFTALGKAVWIVEYKTANATFCPKAIADGYDAMTKKLSLGAYRVAC